MMMTTMMMMMLLLLFHLTHPSQVVVDALCTRLRIFPANIKYFALMCESEDGPCWLSSSQNINQNAFVRQNNVYLKVCSSIWISIVYAYNLIEVVKRANGIPLSSLTNECYHLIHWLTDSLTHWLTHWLTDWLTDSLTLARCASTQQTFSSLWRIRQLRHTSRPSSSACTWLHSLMSWMDRRLILLWHSHHSRYAASLLVLDVVLKPNVVIVSHCLMV